MTENLHRHCVENAATSNIENSCRYDEKPRPWFSPREPKFKWEVFYNGLIAVQWHAYMYSAQSNYSLWKSWRHWIWEMQMVCVCASWGVHGELFLYIHRNRPLISIPKWKSELMAFKKYSSCVFVPHWIIVLQIKLTSSEVDIGCRTNSSLWGSHS